jgi:hypothetical protein
MNENDWKELHNSAIKSPKPGFERAIIKMLEGWEEYAKAHESKYESKISEDYVFGDEWSRVGSALRSMLNGELGKRLQAGTIDGRIVKAWTDAGFTDTGLFKK